MQPSAAAVAPAVALAGVGHAYGEVRVLAGIDLRLAAGEVIALLGPSGCGKTTLLRLIAGLLVPSEGRIAIGGETVADAAARRFVPPERRGLGMVFQDYALWPHLTVAQNVAFPLEMQGVKRVERRLRAEAALARVGLAGFADRQPAALSGGQQQRVAIARAVVAEPKLVLFDEPLSNLDRELRDQLAAEIGSLLHGLGLSGVYVTHDQAEAFALADRVAVMQGGRIVQCAPPEDLVRAPASPAVAEFLQLGALLRAEGRPDGWWLEAPGRLVPVHGQPARGPGRLLLARQALRLADGAAALGGTVRRSVFRGDHYAVTIELAADANLDAAVTVAATRRQEVGARVHLAVDPTRLVFFPDTPSAFEAEDQAHAA